MQLHNSHLILIAHYSPRALHLLILDRIHLPLTDVVEALGINSLGLG